MIEKLMRRAATLPSNRCDLMKKQHFVLFAMACLLVAATVLGERASGAIVVDFQSAMIDPGGQQEIDVYISSLGGNQNLFLYDLSFSLVPLSATAGTSITFVSPMSESFVVNDADYVFSGNSMADGDPGVIFLVEGAGSIVKALDETFSGNNVTISSSSTPRLLSRLTVQHNRGDASWFDVAGNTFEIVMNQQPGFDEAFFEDDDFNALPVEFEFGTSGIITVATVIPEPSTLVFTGMIALGILPLRRRRSH